MKIEITAKGTSPFLWLPTLEIRDFARFACAVGFADRFHGHQKYNKVEPYLHHLFEVVDWLVRAEVDLETMVVGLLHDVIEDTPALYSEVYDEFGKEVADAVVVLSCPKGIPRIKGHRLTYPKLAKSEMAVSVKLADRLANMSRGGKNTMYLEEWDYFKTTLYNPAHNGSVQYLWGKLEALVTKAKAAQHSYIEQ